MITDSSEWVEVDESIPRHKTDVPSVLKYPHTSTAGKSIEKVVLSQWC